MIEITRQGNQHLQQLLTNSKQEKEEIQVDPKLATWLQGLGLNESAQKILLAEGYTLDDVLHHITLDDLKRIGLKGGSQLRIWRAIPPRERNNAPPLSNGDIQPMGKI